MNENKTRGVTREIALTLCLSPQRGARAGLFIEGDQRSYYNDLNTPNYQTH
jgi:hypothetical protein